MNIIYNLWEALTHCFMHFIRCPVNPPSSTPAWKLAAQYDQRLNIAHSMSPASTPLLYWSTKWHSTDCICCKFVNISSSSLQWEVQQQKKKSKLHTINLFSPVRRLILTIQCNQIIYKTEHYSFFHWAISLPLWSICIQDSFRPK